MKVNISLSKGKNYLRHGHGALSLTDRLKKCKADEAAQERQTVDTQAVESGGSRVGAHLEAEL